MTFNKRITIQRLQRDGEGSFADEDWVNVCNPWANWVNVHGSEVWAVESVQAQKAATVTIRYRKDIDEQCRIVYNGVVYDIVSIDNIREQNRVLEMKVRAAVNG